ncbi:MAG: TetR family transcriptional regulator [Candidatus Lokiarchaeota archaeon]|nr:TetR family transcriptional regulator [Candidatus Lokiarchaeota archaeon]MBD3201975.1 TetR family transcriptional regulator [Candidatus Lokiarchaeota archaeon]
MNKTKQKILEEAFKQFSENSYAKTSVETIAENINVSKGAIFHYYDTKSELAIDCFFYRIESILNDDEIKLQSVDSPKEKITLLVKTFFKKYTKLPKLIQFLIEIYDILKSKEESTNIWQRIYGQIEGIMIKLLKDCEIKNPELRAPLLLSCLDGLVIFKTLTANTERELDYDELLEELIYIFLS